MNNSQPRKKRVRKSLLVGFGAVAVLLLAVIIVLGVSLFPEQEGKEITSYHPFRSAEAKELYLKSYDQKAKKWPVVSETRMVDTSYDRTFVRISGPEGAPPLVLLHGMGGNSLQWIPNIEALSGHYRT